MSSTTPNVPSSPNVPPVMKKLVAPVIIALLIFGIFLYVTIFIFRTYNKTTLETSTLLKSPAPIPQKISNNQLYNKDAMPKLFNGIEFSYSFWLFVCAEDMQDSTSDKLILARTPNPNSLLNASPIFSMDGQTNKIHVSLRLNESSSKTLQSILLDKDTYHTTTIDYVPLQRWVNIILVVDNQFVQIFVDGELRNVEDIAVSNETKKIPSSPSGSLSVGKISNSNTLNKNSFISKIQVSNYAYTIDHSKILYKSGPLNSSILSSLGINSIGVRNPFYTISPTLEPDENCTQT